MSQDIISFVSDTSAISEKPGGDVDVNEEQVNEEDLQKYLADLELVEEEELRDEFTTPFDLMTDAEFLDYVNEMETSIRHLQLENQIFFDFLRNHNPSVLESLEQMMSYAETMAAVAAGKQVEPIQEPSIPSGSKGSSTVSLSAGSKKSRQSSRLTDSLPSVANLMEGRGPKINLVTKTEMVTKAMEDAQTAHESFVRKAAKEKRNLKSEMEEFALRESDLTYSKNQFEFNVVVNGVDPLTGRISAEKWIKFMDDWLRFSALTMEKLRLRTASLKNEYKKLSTTYLQRKELGANVHAVDFDQLEIANKHLLVKIDQKQVHLVELKKMNGGANLILSKHKKYLLHQQADFSKLKGDIAAKEDQITDLENEYNKVEDERDAARNQLELFKKFKNQYRVPDVMEYVVLKKDLDEIKKNIKIWQRRKNIQDISLNASIGEIKHLTGSKTLDPTWIKDQVTDEGDEDFEFNM